MAGMMNKLGETLNMGGKKEEDKNKMGQQHAGDQHKPLYSGDNKQTGGDQHKPLYSGDNRQTPCVGDQHMQTPYGGDQHMQNPYGGGQQQSGVPKEGLLDKVKDKIHGDGGQVKTGQQHAGDQHKPLYPGDNKQAPYGGGRGGQQQSGEPKVGLMDKVKDKIHGDGQVKPGQKKERKKHADGHDSSDSD